MSDEIDRASDLQEALDAFRLADQRQKANKRELTPSGECHWCGDPTEDAQKLFCCKDCSTDWHKHTTTRR